MNELEVFTAALELEDAPARASFLDDACGGHPELRSRIEALLRNASEASRYLESPPDNIQETLDELITERVGSLVGPYKLLEQIGEGGMGVVFMAQQSQPVKRRVALKLIKPGMDSRQIVARFEAERQALALMDHPHIARVLDAGQTELGHPYFVMELVRGIPITDYCDREQLDTRRRLKLMIDVCRAVQHAHQKAIIHRDLKPSNVLVTLHDGEPVVKVIDFGVAKALDQELTQRTLFTQFTQLVGTPLYMSPEQAELSGLDIDTRSDIYSLGVLLYELLTGTTPFDKTALAPVGFDEMRRMIREVDPPRPSVRISTFEANALSTVSDCRKIDPRKFSQQLRGELDWIVMKSLEKDRNRRYDSANALAADIQRYLDDEPVAACPPSTTYRLRKFAVRNKAVLTTALLVCTALIIGSVVSMWHAVRATLAESKAERHATEARQQEVLVRAREESLRHYLYASDMKLAWHAWEYATYTNDVVLVRHLLARHEPKSNQEDLRSFAWYYLKGLCGQSARSTLHGHEGKVYHVAISKDGKTLASASQDGTARLWDLATAQLRYTLRGHASEVNCVAFAPDGKTLATASDDRSVKFWDVSDGQAKSTPTLIGLSMPVHRVEFSSNGQILVTGELSEQQDAAATTLWDLPSGRQQRKLDGHFPLAISPDSRTLATTEWDKTVRLWDVTSGHERHVIRGHTGTVLTGMFSLDGSLLATGSHDGPVRILDPRTGQQRTSCLYWQPYSVHSVAWSPDNKLLAAGYENGGALLWELSSGRSLAVFLEHDERVRAVRFSPDGGTFVCASDDCTIKLWDVSEAYRVNTPPDQSAPVNSISFSPDSELLATSIGQNKCLLWHVPTGEAREFALNQSDQGVRCVAYSPDGQVVAIASSDNAVYLLDPITGNQRLAISCPKALIGSLTFSPDGDLLVGGFDDGAICVWDTRTGKTLHIVDAATHDLGPHRIAFSPDGKTLAFQIQASVVQRLDLATGRLRELRTGHYNVICLAYSPDGQTLATGAPDRRIKLWGTDADQEIANLSGIQGGVNCLAFSPDSKILASGGGELMLWDVATTQELFRLVGHTGAITRLAFSPDGKTLASAGAKTDGQGEIRFWRTATTEVKHNAAVENRPPGSAP